VCYFVCRKRENLKNILLSSLFGELRMSDQEGSISVEDGGSLRRQSDELAAKVHMAELRLAEIRNNRTKQAEAAGGATGGYDGPPVTRGVDGTLSRGEREFPARGAPLVSQGARPKVSPVPQMSEMMGMQSEGAARQERLERWKYDMRRSDAQRGYRGEVPLYKDLLNTSRESASSTELVAPDVDTPRVSGIGHIGRDGRPVVTGPMHGGEERRTHSTPLVGVGQNVTGSRYVHYGSASPEFISRTVDCVLDEEAGEKASRLRLAAAAPTKFEEDGVWRYFLADFRETIQMSGLRASDQLGYLKRALPEKAIRLLHQYGVETLEDAIVMLTGLYEPGQDSSTAMQAIGGIMQKGGERLTGLAGRIKEVVRRYADTMDLRRSDIEKMVTDRFKHAIADKDTRNFLLWDPSVMTLAEFQACYCR
jgi:hypothetical protein